MTENALEPGWEEQIVRAYATFDVDPVDGAAEFGRLWKRAAKRALGHVTKPVKSAVTPDPPDLNLAFERLHPRWQKGNRRGGQFKDKSGPRIGKK